MCFRHSRGYSPSRCSFPRPCVTDCLEVGEGILTEHDGGSLAELLANMEPAAKAAEARRISVPQQLQLTDMISKWV